MANKLDLADAQLIGWHHGFHGFSIISLVQSMSLTKSEWKKLKTDYSLYLSDDEAQEIDEYFKVNIK
jgi:hypothetical protein